MLSDLIELEDGSFEYHVPPDFEDLWSVILERQDSLGQMVSQRHPVGGLRGWCWRRKLKRINTKEISPGFAGLGPLRTLSSDMRYWKRNSIKLGGHLNYFFSSQSAHDIAKLCSVWPFAPEIQSESFVLDEEEIHRLHAFLGCWDRSQLHFSFGGDATFMMVYGREEMLMQVCREVARL